MLAPRRIMVVDGMGGRIGQEIVQRLRASFGERVEILAVGTNSTAASAMLIARPVRSPLRSIRAIPDSSIRSSS